MFNYDWDWIVAATYKKIIFKQAKPFTLHISLLLFVFVYAFCGGLIFNYLEAEATIQQNQNEQKIKNECISKVYIFIFLKNIIRFYLKKMILI